MYSLKHRCSLPPVSLESAPLFDVHEAACTDDRYRALHISPGSWCNRDRPFQTARTAVCQVAFVPGSRLNSTDTPRRSHCLSHILAFPWVPGGITATTQLPAHRRGPLHILKPDIPSVQQLVDELLLEIALRAAESAVESTIQLPASASSHAADRHPEHTLSAPGGEREDLQIPSTHTVPDLLSPRNEGVDGLPCSRPRARACRPIWSSRTEPWPVHWLGPLRAFVCTAATHARPGPRSRGL